VEGRIPDSELRAEDAVHPCGRAQNCFVGQHFLAAARQSAMAARHDALLVAQYDMAAVGPPGSKERQESAVTPLDTDPLAVARSYFFLVEGVGDGGFGVVQQTARREGKGDFERRPTFTRVFDAFDQAEVSVARRRWVIRFIEAKERPARPIAGRERRCFGLQGCARRLELRAGIAYLRRRIAIAQIKTEYGLLTAEEQDELLLAGAELKAELELWGQYR